MEFCHATSEVKMEKNVNVNCNYFLFLIKLFGITLTICCANSMAPNYDNSKYLCSLLEDYFYLILTRDFDTLNGKISYLGSRYQTHKADMPSMASIYNTNSLFSISAGGISGIRVKIRFHFLISDRHSPVDVKFSASFLHIS